MTETSPDSRPLRRAGIRTATAVGGVAALAAAFVAGTAYDPDVTTMPDFVTANALHLPADAPLAVADDCEALLADYRERGAIAVTAYGWEETRTFDWATEEMIGLSVPQASSDGFSARKAPVRTSRVTTSETGTNVQEVGVDEPDVVKTDGTHLWTLEGNLLTAYDVSTPEGKSDPERLSMIRLPDLGDATTRYGESVRAELMLAGDHLVAVGAPARTPRSEDPDTRVVVVDVSDPAAPAVTHERTVDARVDSVRLHDGVVRFVLKSALPDLDFVEPGDDRTERQARRHNVELVEATTLDDWLPQVTDSDGTSRAVGCDRVAVPVGESPLGTTTVLTLDPTEPDETDAVAIASATDISYTSHDRLVLATTTARRNFWSSRTGALTRDDGRTHLWSFALDGMATTYAAAGQVDGRIDDRWAIDAADDTLRVAVGETVATGNFNSVITLTETDRELVELGRLDRLGVGEDIKAVRWFDDLALVVTFRQVDPLYAVDLSDPADPTLLAELKIPGFSEYLHPLGSERMIGMGQDADARTGWSLGAQASLFDVSDLADPRRLDTVTYPRNSVAGAAADPRQFLWVPEARTALTVVSRGWEGRTGWLSQLHLSGGKFHETRTRVEYGTDVDRVRLVPLPDVADHGRVVLVTGDGVQYVDVA